MVSREEILRILEIKRTLPEIRKLLGAKGEDAKELTRLMYSMDNDHEVRREGKVWSLRIAVEKRSVSAENVDLIPEVCEPYISSKIDSLDEMIVLGRVYDNHLNCLIEGETGCGKTHAVRYLAYQLRVPYMRVSLNGATTPDDLIGQWVPSEHGFRWQDGVLTRMVRHGGIFVCDEINGAEEGVLFVLNMLLDDERKLVLVAKDGEVVKAHPDFVFFATMNPSENAIYGGTRPLNAALRDRFDVILKFKYSKSVEKELISGPMADIVVKIRKEIKAGNISTPISTRVLKQYVTNIKLFGEESALVMFINRFTDAEKEVIEEVVKMGFSGKEAVK